MDSTNHHKYLVRACEIASEAGRIIMRYYSDGYETKTKQDNSPVTEADIAANRYITAELKKMAPDIPIIAEEDDELGSTEHKRFFLVDPLDGTKSFVRGEPEFTVNIGLVENHHPVLGVIYCPPQETLYYAHVNGSAYRQIKGGKPEAIKTRQVPKEGLTIVKSRSHPSKATQAYLDTLKIKEVLPSSGSAKFCSVAEGSADLYPRFGRTMEWDTAAGHAILIAAGGRVETLDGKPFLYNKPGFENPGFIAFGSK